MRLNIERQKELEPKRMGFAISVLTSLGFKIHYQDSTKIKFLFKEQEITFYPYSGWHTGKTIKDGRGIDKLIKQLNNEN